ncbi:hypothetical protein D3C85_1204540 [compost metagenome]
MGALQLHGIAGDGFQGLYRAVLGDCHLVRAQLAGGLQGHAGLHVMTADAQLRVVLAQAMANHRFVDQGLAADLALPAPGNGLLQGDIGRGAGHYRQVQTLLLQATLQQTADTAALGQAYHRGVVEAQVGQRQAAPAQALARRMADTGGLAVDQEQGQAVFTVADQQQPVGPRAVADERLVAA